MTAHISCRSLTHIELQIPRWRTKWRRNNRTIQNSTEFKASSYVLHDIRLVAALVDISRNKTIIERQKILDIRQVAALNFAPFWWWVAYVHMCVCCCTYVAYICAYVREKIMFEVYGGESESMSDQWKFFLIFSHLLNILHFSVWQLLCWPFLLISPMYDLCEWV